MHIQYTVQNLKKEDCDFKMIITTNANQSKNAFDNEFILKLGGKDEVAHRLHFTKLQVLMYIFIEGSQGIQ